MISVICVFNDRKILENNLLASLHKQDVDFELLLVDNTQGQFASIPTALNSVASKARYNYIMFAHQDIYLIAKSWLKRAEQILDKLGEMGVAGVTGASEQGEFVGFIVDRGRLWGAPIKEPVSVFTLDECLFVVPRNVFLKNRLDEGFEYHSYSADLCLRLRKQGLKAYVIPCPICHNSATFPILRAGSIEKDDLRLYAKHGHIFPVIPKTMRRISGPMLSGRAARKHIRRLILSYRFLDVLYVKHQILTSLTTEGLLLDFGTIPMEQQWIQQAKKHSYSIGVSSSRQYLLVSDKLGVHNDYVLASSAHLPFRRCAFDVVLIKGLLEYLKKEESVRALGNALHVARRKVISIVPNKGYPLGNAYKCYLSKWSAEDLERLGFKIHGMELRTDLEAKVKVLRLTPFFKTILTKIFPSSVANELLCIKDVA